MEPSDYNFGSIIISVLSLVVSLYTVWQSARANKLGKIALKGTAMPSIIGYLETSEDGILYIIIKNTSHRFVLAICHPQ